MTTREEMAEACAWAAPTLDRGPAGPDDDREGIEMGRRLMHAHLQLKRDGELRERLAAYANDLLSSNDPEEFHIHRDIGATIEALLKEFP